MLRRPINTWVQWLEERARARKSSARAIDAPIANQRRPSAPRTSAFIIIYSPRACRVITIVPFHSNVLLSSATSLPLFHLPIWEQDQDDRRWSWKFFSLREIGEYGVCTRVIQLFLRRINEMEIVLKDPCWSIYIYVCTYIGYKKIRMYY